ncbi:phage integrase N-terminal SAM-like domain-containing protein [Bacteroides sp. 1_1_14]|uniref:phage integrase N-terminal SAM-like domain-containing protein n=1 Tax=Bacteroides TaxID=816 RepID=UPI0001D8A077|nr:phage integrase N-terminal SAM-like domain-containing protein [Bacteroides sp. 1_1_14]EFI04742.1 tyrosine recombinase [Bacteroides sp. 1_1_14]
MPDEIKNIKTYRKKERMILSRSIRRRRRYIEVAFGNNDAARLLLSMEKGVLFESNKAYLPAEDFVLAEFFDRYVNLAFIDYSKVTDTTNKPEKEKTIRPELPAGFLEKLKQMRYSDHTIRVYTTYIGDFQQYFAGSNLKRISPDEINAYLLYLIDKKNISSCQQNQRINAINMICKRPKMYFENPTINNMFRFLDGYYMSEVIHTPEEERMKCEKREELFWNSFYKFLANKYNKEIVNKNISSYYIIEDMLKEISANKEDNFELFVDNFNEFYRKNINLREI